MTVSEAIGVGMAQVTLHRHDAVSAGFLLAPLFLPVASDVALPCTDATDTETMRLLKRKLGS